MPAERVPYEQQLQLIMECRSSGLSDYQWCREHNIRPGTFYNWVSRHRKKACEGIPDAGVQNKTPIPAPQQEIVRIDPKQLSGDSPEHPALSVTECIPVPVASATPDHSSSCGHALEIVLNGAILRVSNDISPGLLSQTIRLLKGITC